MNMEFYIGFGFAVISAIAGVWWRLQNAIDTQSKSQASDVSSVRLELANFRLEVSKNYVNGDAMMGLEKRLIASEERMIAAIDKLTDRLDRIIERIEHSPKVR
jgi:ribosome-associated translation inhibitor RaiA